jgi:Asp-tRNA(Asn)/Glu-tRNA(Gln) amidotransferase A subunit family amidase
LAQARPPSAPRIGLYDEANWNALSAETSAALRHAVRALREAGATTIPLARHPLHDDLNAAQQSLMDWEVPRALAFERTRMFDRLSAVTQAFVSRRPPDPADYDAARALALAARANLADVFGGVDAWLEPAAPGTAPPGLGSTGDPIFNRLWTVLHCPCLALPCITVGGLPVGVQLITAADDATALALAALLEGALSEI